MIGYPFRVKEREQDQWIEDNKDIYLGMNGFLYVCESDYDIELLIPGRIFNEHIRTGGSLAHLSNIEFHAYCEAHQHEWYILEWVKKEGEQG